MIGRTISATAQGSRTHTSDALERLRKRGLGVVAGCDGDVRNRAATAEQTHCDLHAPLAQQVERCAADNSLETCRKRGPRHERLLCKRRDGPRVLRRTNQFQRCPTQLRISEPRKQAGGEQACSDGEAQYLGNEHIGELVQGHRQRLALSADLRCPDHRSAADYCTDGIHESVQPRSPDCAGFSSGAESVTSSIDRENSHVMQSL